MYICSSGCSPRRDKVANPALYISHKISCQMSRCQQYVVSNLYKINKVTNLIRNGNYFRKQDILTKFRVVQRKTSQLNLHCLCVTVNLYSTTIRKITYIYIY